MFFFFGTTIGSETSNLAVPEVEKRTHHIIIIWGQHRRSNINEQRFKHLRPNQSPTPKHPDASAWIVDRRSLPPRSLAPRPTTKSVDADQNLEHLVRVVPERRRRQHLHHARNRSHVQTRDSLPLEYDVEGHRHALERVGPEHLRHGARPALQLHPAADNLKRVRAELRGGAGDGADGREGSRGDGSRDGSRDRAGEARHLAPRHHPPPDAARLALGAARWLCRTRNLRILLRVALPLRQLRGDVLRREVVLGVRVRSLLRGDGDEGVAARGREPRLRGVHPRRGVAHVPRPDVHRHPVRGGSVLPVRLPRVVGGSGGSRVRISRLGRHGGARERVGDARVPEPRRGRSRGPVERR
mmetsp:Transcript_15104/g.63546  ORF Transcript_15104/g.63546 Transcript_15104/m.63546 type:complete len:356 (+) Transcript_15104:10-1077(+)